MSKLLALLAFLALAFPCYAAPKKSKSVAPPPAPAVYSLSPEKFLEMKVEAGVCGEESATTYASAIRIGEKGFLISAAPDFAPGAKVCAKALAQGFAPLDTKLAYLDHAFGFAAYQLPAELLPYAFPLRVNPGRHMDTENFSYIPDAFGLAVKLQPTDRHHFNGLAAFRSAEYNHYDPPAFEAYPVGGKDDRYLRGVGASVVGQAYLGRDNSLYLYGVFSNQVVVTLPGEPARVYRQRDLRLLRAAPPLYFPVVLSPATIQEWLRPHLADGRKEGELQFLRKEEKETSNTVEWKFGDSFVTESCFRAGAMPSELNIPVGGINPVGVGGLEDLLSQCRFRVRSKNESGKETTENLLVAYRRKNNALEIRSPQNMADLLQYWTSDGWRLLFDRDAYKDTDLDQLRGKREAALLAREKVAAFFRAKQGDPLLLRRAYVLASFALGGSEVPGHGQELERVARELKATELREREAWEDDSPAGAADLAKMKLELVASLENLALAWEKGDAPIPLTQEEYRRMLEEDMPKSKPRKRR